MRRIALIGLVAGAVFAAPAAAHNVYNEPGLGGFDGQPFGINKDLKLENWEAYRAVPVTMAFGERRNVQAEYIFQRVNDTAVWVAVSSSTRTIFPCGTSACPKTVASWVWHNCLVDIDKVNGGGAYMRTEVLCHAVYP